MLHKLHWYRELLLSLKNLIIAAIKPKYKLINIHQCKTTGCITAIIKLATTQTIEKKLDDIITDNAFLQNLDPITIRTLTYLATIERVKPEYSIITHKIHAADDYTLELKSKSQQKTITKSPLALSKDQEIITRLSSLEANKVGYMAGVYETLKEQKMRRKGI